MKQIYQVAAVAMLVAGAAVSAMAQQQNEPRIYREGNAWVEEITGTLPAARSLRVDIAVGSVHVDGGNNSDITYTIKDRVYSGSEDSARRRLLAMRASARMQGDVAVIESQGFNGGKMGGEVWVRVPRGMDSARLSTRGGAIAVNNLGGRLVAETAGGGITLAGLGGVADATTMGGDIVVDTASADLRLHTNGGRIRVNSANARLTADTMGGDLVVGSARGPVTLETNGGSIRVSRTESDLKAETAGGNIEAGDIGGSAVLETAGGTIRLNSARGLVHAETASGAIHLGRVQGGIRAETANGGITAEFAGAKLTDSTLETAVGDITVYIPSNLACSVRAAVEMASGHSIRSDFPEVKITTRRDDDQDYGPREQSAAGPINGGGPLLRLRTNMGDIQILRASAH